jgi:hypothetical protein
VAFTALVRSRFDIKDHGELSGIIGMHITKDRTARTISLDHGKYVRELLQKHDMVNCKPSCRWNMLFLLLFQSRHMCL